MHLKGLPLTLLVLLLISGCGRTVLVGSGGRTSAYPDGWIKVHPVRVDLPLRRPVMPSQPRPDIRGVVLVNIWESGCVPCRKELPLLQRVSNQQRVTIIGLTRDVSVTSARQALTEHGVRYANWMDTDASFAVALDGRVPINAVPSSVLLRDGQAVAVHIGPFRSTAEIVRFLK